MHWEGALDADAETDLAHGEGLLETSALTANDHALEDLDALAGTLNHAHVDLQGIAGSKGGDVVAK